MKKKCLVMILGNESLTIARCLRSVRNQIDCWSICCNGSDDTREIVQRELAGIPGVIHERPWKNFGHNRTESFQLAKEWLINQGHDIAQVWCLLLDADHELKGTIDVDALDSPGHRIRQRDPAETIDYANTRLIRASNIWRCRGVTHEVWMGPGGELPELSGCFIVDHGDGGSKGNKLERDEALLRAGLLDPDDADMHARYKFYLAQTLQDAHRWEEAADWYQQRSEIRGQFEEERWMASYRRGRCLLWMGKHAEGEAQLTRAWEERPHRIEPLYWLAKHHLDQGRNWTAHMLAGFCAVTTYPKDDLLFVEPHCYGDGPLEIASISSFYVKEPTVGLQACEALMPSKSPHGRQNICWYAERIEGKREKFEVPEELRTFEGVVYHCSSPSVCDDITLVRLVNYEQERGRRYWGRPDPWQIRTKAVIRKGSEPWRALDDSILERWPAARIQGLEDIRLVNWEGRLWFTATSCQVPGADGNPQVVMGRITDVRVDILEPIPYAGRQKIEKNWVLWPRYDGIHCIYSFDPFVVLKVDGRHQADEVYRNETRWYPGRFRGSSPPVPFGSHQWLAVVHDVSNLANENVYTHRFVMLGQRGIARYSKPFLLEKRGIEYVAGLEFDCKTDELVIGYSVEDRSAHSLRIKLSDAMGLFS